MTRKSLYLIVGISVMIISSATAQFGKGDKLLDLGVGANSAYSGIPLHLAFEVGVSDVLSVGAGLDFIGNRYVVSGVRYGYIIFYPAARVSYHFNKVFKLNIEELDIYGGGSLGFRAFSWTDDSPGSVGGYNSNVFASVHVGARWYFKPSFGVFAEAGAGGSGNLRAGMVLRF